ASCSWSKFPLRDGISLPGRLTRCGCGPTEMEYTRLSAGICVDAKVVVVLPDNMQPAGKPHDVCCAVGSALLAGRLVASRIPCVSDFAAFGIQRQRVVNALPWRDHAELPVLHDHGYPIAGQIDGSSLPAGLRRSTASSSLGVSGWGETERQ